MPEEKKESADAKALRYQLMKYGIENLQNFMTDGHFDEEKVRVGSPQYIYDIADLALKFASEFALRNSVSSIGNRIETLRLELKEK